MRCVIGGETYVFRDDVWQDEAVRRSFDALAQKTFGLSFERWYRRGYWQNDYLPHVLTIGDRVAANISVNLCPVRLDGKPRRLIQLGTVMTEEGFRGRGLSRFLMERVLEIWESRCDGIYLYANDSVLDFYPKFGFERATEYRYALPFAGAKQTAVRLSMEKAADVRLLLEAFARGNPFARLTMAGNEGLLMFYCSQYLQEGIRYLPDAGAAALIESHGDTTLVWDIFGGTGTPLRDVLAAVAPEGTKRIRFGFTPAETEGMEAMPFREPDTTLFVRGGDIGGRFAGERLMFPLLSHA